MQILIRKAQIVDITSVFNNRVVDLYIENGFIKDIAEHLDVPAQTIIEGDGLMVSQGWVDVFADYCEPGFEHKETIVSGLNAAANGGFTDVFLIPNTFPALSSKSIIEYVLGKAIGNIVNLHPLGTATQNAEGKDLAEMMDMRCSGAIAFTDGKHPIQNAGLALKSLEYVKAFNGIILQIPNDVALSSGGLMNEGIVSTMLGMPAIPAISETLMLYRDIELLRYSNSRLHVTGISTEASVELVKKAKAEGLQITCSVTPFHLSLTDDVLKTYKSVYKVAPPLRTESDRLALIEGLKDGIIDSIASHHCPQDWDAKEKEFEYAANGMAVQQIAYNIIWDSIKDIVSIETLIDKMTTLPRQIFGLKNNSIKVGAEAVITIFTTCGKYILDKENVKSKSSNNPYQGKELSGRVIGIVNNNQLHLNK